jgi:hypothetical protein
MNVWTVSIWYGVRKFSSNSDSNNRGSDTRE